MQISFQALMAIGGMALVTYITRIGGVWLMSHITLSRRMKVWLEYIPGTVIVALVAPTVFTTGFAEAGAALVTLVVAARTRKVLLAMVVGVVVVWGLRTLLTILR